MKIYQASCHCGSISYTATVPEINLGLRCNCSLCIRKGALMTEFTVPPEAFELSVKDDALACYQFGSEVAKHYFCNKCGIYTHHETRVKPGHIRLNIGCIKGLDATSLPAGLFDGAAI